ncbi:MAG TPA: ATP-binding cassette domain-containing protein [Alphaproteobacteria bacterium]|nr:ATP-binding cassette domain-containing protein [Alphaproteobacteria bacterium]
MAAPALAPADALLRVEKLSMRFGGLLAVDDLSFAARARQITAIIGPNGAGKTTVFNCLTGFYRASSGRITLNGPKASYRLERLPGYRIAQAGVARTFQNVRLFPRMTALENLLAAQHRPLMVASAYSLAALVSLPGYRHAEQAAHTLACSWLERIGLLAEADNEAGTLSYGAQRRLEVARAMCMRPFLLCLDEPAAGLNPRESDELKRLLLGIREEEGIGILLIEHDMSVVMGLSDRILVLDQGGLIASGTPAEVSRDPAVIRAYLGEPEPGAAGHPGGAAC